ncbi:hypothetical protein [Ammonifex degensii]|uniref:hypothetical protein n=1 Tax=Ammonifex degensii TaxID=42838 RepID=UPI00059E5091|nr:hypothetical protein [Ammonifex degensii]
MEEAKREPRAEEFPYRVASPEFFFLLQRIDRLDEKLSAEISAVRQEIRQEVASLKGHFWGAVAAITAVFTLGVVVLEWVLRR